MLPRGSVLLAVLVLLGLLLSDPLVRFFFSPPTPDSALGSGRGHRIHARHQQRQDERQQDRARDRTKVDRAQKRTQKDREHDRTLVERVGDWETFCTGPESIQLTKTEGCTHGPDPVPQGLDVEQAVPPLSVETAALDAALTAIACEGDGQSGNRVQVLYIRGSDVPSRFTRYVASIRAWTAQADTIFQTSAAATGSIRRLRLVQDPTSCLPLVEEVVLTPNGDGAFSTTIAELKSRGYTRNDRIYLVFVDTTSAGICGVGTLWVDDQADGNVNWNNTGPSYSRVDAGCWSGHVAAHELMHNLGGVQNSAPNASGGFHCIDEYDVMCYMDGASALTLRLDCSLLAADTTRFDCGHNDYYNTNPPAGSYLATHWNPANNRFLIGSPLPPPPPPPPPPAPPEIDTDTKKDKHDKKDKHSGKHRNGKHHKKRH